eukprot:500618_1
MLIANAFFTKKTLITCQIMSCLNCGGSGKVFKRVTTHLMTCPCCNGLSYGCTCPTTLCQYKLCNKGEIYTSNSSHIETRKVPCDKCNGSGAAFIPKTIETFTIDTDSDEDDWMFQTDYERKKAKQKLIVNQPKKKNKHIHKFPKKVKKQKQIKQSMTVNVNENENIYNNDYDIIQIVNKTHGANDGIDKPLNDKFMCDVQTYLLLSKSFNRETLGELFRIYNKSVKSRTMLLKQYENAMNTTSDVANRMLITRNMCNNIF